MLTKRYCLALDLKDDPDLIAEYETYHRNVWPEILDSIKESGIHSIEIYRVENRLFMIMETHPGFTFSRKAELDKESEKVAEWERLMWNYQEGLPNSKPGEKWRLMDKIFDFNNSDDK